MSLLSFGDFLKPFKFVFLPVLLSLPLGINVSIWEETVTQQHSFRVKRIEPGKLRLRSEELVSGYHNQSQ